MILFTKKPQKGTLKNKAILAIDNWDDYSFKTLFHLTVYDKNGNEHQIGSVKIGYFDQKPGRTEEKIQDSFNALSKQFFSLGQDPEYYKNIKEKLSSDLSSFLLESLRDIVADDDLFNKVQEENVFRTSLLRTVSLSVIYGQFKRILSGGAILTEFRFTYKTKQSESNSGIKLEFHIKPLSLPPTNIHILIGRNGVGKTTLLNNMLSSVIDTDSNENFGQFYELNYCSDKKISDDYFSSITSLSFSAFDPFIPPDDQPDRTQGTCYFYIGLKKVFVENKERKSKLKDSSELCSEFVGSLRHCLALDKKRELWLNAINELESDLNFSEMNLSDLSKIDSENKLVSSAKKLFTRMSSGHAIILLSLTKLVETVEEKTLVLIDEPESHLHPPLLSAFTRALSDLLINRNAIAIIATHSPVVLQEVPKSCVWILRRTRLTSNADRPENETFGENVGVLTREVFGLEVSKSGFHKLLEQSVLEGNDYDEILHKYGSQLGFEGRAILKSLISNRNTNI